MDLYAENILDHYRNPRGKLPLPMARPDDPVGRGESRGEGHPPLSYRSGRGVGGEGVTIHSELNPACGDEITVGLTIQNDRVASLQWEGAGCAISQAAMSLLSEEFLGKPEKDIDAFTKENMLALLGVPIGPRRLKCALLGLHACKNALRKAQGKTMRVWAESVLHNGAAGED